MRAAGDYMGLGAAIGEPQILTQRSKKLAPVTDRAASAKTKVRKTRCQAGCGRECSRLRGANGEGGALEHWTFAVISAMAWLIVVIAGLWPRNSCVASPVGQNASALGQSIELVPPAIHRYQSRLCLTRSQSHNDTCVSTFGA